MRAIYTYSLGTDYSQAPVVGGRVLVQLGAKTTYAGIVVRFLPDGTLAPPGVKEVLEVLDATPVLQPEQLELFQWMADYYACSPGDVLKAALPTGLKLQSELRVLPVDGLQPPDGLATWMYLFLDALEEAVEMTQKEAAEALGVKNPKPKLKQLEALGLVRLIQLAESRYHVKTVRCLELTTSLENEADLAKAFEGLSHAPQQEALLLLVAEAQSQGRQLIEAEALKRLGATSAVTQALLKKESIKRVEVPVDRLAGATMATRRPALTLTKAQQSALGALQTSFAEDPAKPVLLHGITGSGKTQIYLQLLEDTLARGEQALYMVPEISLTQQAIERLQARFGPVVGAYHSRYSEAERVEIWQKVLSGSYRVVLGARSSVFLPFENLGLIVVDEEHDRSFKQQEVNPRYQARDVAVWLGSQYRIPVVLGSATPALETYANANAGRFGLVELNERPLGGELPELELVDMRAQHQQRLSHGPFSDRLLEELRRVVAAGEQAIVFKNRRGFSPLVVCDTCGHIPNCPYCDIGLTYHQASDELRCHYCGFTDKQTRQCRQCASTHLRREGMGTERIEEHLREVFPDFRILRMDLDTTRGKQGFERIISRFAAGEYDVLVGTQMVTKGLDFPRVTLAAVLQTDSLLHYPDFRAVEQAYQLLTQFSGRAGRAGQAGRVLLQTHKTDHPFFAWLRKSYTDFYNAEVAQRETLSYPPHSRLIRIEIRHRDSTYLAQEATRLTRLIKPWLGDSLLGPEYPPIPRLRALYRMQYLIKASRTQTGRALKQRLLQAAEHYYQQAPDKTMRIVIDVDPY